MKKFLLLVIAIALTVFINLSGCSSIDYKGDSERHPGHPGHEVH